MKFVPSVGNGVRHVLSELSGWVRAGRRSARQHARHQARRRGPAIEPLERRVLLSGDFAWSLNLPANSPADTFIATQAPARTVVTTDSAGNLYVAGLFRGTLDLSQAVTSDSSGGANAAPSAAGSAVRQSLGGTDVYIAKFNAAGSLVWVQSLGGPGDDRVGGIAVDAQQNVYLTGSYDTGLKSGALHIVGNADGIASTDDDLPVISSAANPLLTAVAGTTSIDLGVGANGSPSGGTDIFVAKLGADGTMTGSVLAGGAGDNIGRGIALHGDSIDITGSFSGQALFNTQPIVGDPSRFTLQASGTDTQGFAWQLGTDLKRFDWVGNIDASPPAMGAAIGVDAAGNVFAATVDGVGAAMFGAPAPVGPQVDGNATELHVTMLNPHGQVIHVSELPSDQPFDAINSVVVSNVGDVYVVASVYSLAPIIPGTPGSPETPGTAGTAGSLSIPLAATDSTVDGLTDSLFVGRYNAQGVPLWRDTFTNTSGLLGRALTLDGQGNVYVAGVLADGATNVSLNAEGGATNLGSVAIVDNVVTSTGTTYFAPSTLVFAFSLTPGNAGSPANTALAQWGLDEAFVLKLDSAGAVTWAQAMAGPGLGSVDAIAVGMTGEVYLAGNGVARADAPPTGSGNPVVAAADQSAGVVNGSQPVAAAATTPSSGMDAGGLVLVRLSPILNLLGQGFYLSHTADASGPASADSVAVAATGAKGSPQAIPPHLSVDAPLSPALSLVLGAGVYPALHPAAARSAGSGYGRAGSQNDFLHAGQIEPSAVAVPFHPQLLPSPTLDPAQDSAQRNLLASSLAPLAALGYSDDRAYSLVFDEKAYLSGNATPGGPAVATQGSDFGSSIYPYVIVGQFEALGAIGIFMTMD